MQWLNLEMSVLDNEAFACAQTADVGTWLRLMRYCCVQENGGRIRDAKNFDERKLMFLFRLTKSEINQKSELWEWQGNNLRVNYFPSAKLKEILLKRSSAARASKIRWGNRDPKSNPTTDNKSDSSTVSTSKPATHSETESGREGKGKGKERKGRRREGPAAASPDGDGQNPRSLAVCISFFASLGASQGMAEKFYHHYNANGWRQGGGLDIASWHSQAEKWLVDEKPAAEKSSSGAAADEFNPDQEHAHTGGIQLHN